MFTLPAVSDIATELFLILWKRPTMGATRPCGVALRDGLPPEALLHKQNSMGQRTVPGEDRKSALGNAPVEFDVRAQARLPAAGCAKIE